MKPLERDVLPGQTLGGKYQLRRVIGCGGMGTVYEVEHTLTRQRGALKLLRREYAQIEPVVRRFLREASAAGRIGSPHIVQTFDAGELATGQPYIFMELLEGEPLRGLLDRRGRLTFDEAFALVAQAAAGLRAAHAVGIVHRDIKPDNLFVCGGVRPFVKLLDFGISKFRLAEGEPAVTRDGEMIGTPLYMAPEQVSGGQEADPRLDVYALAVVLYEMLTGQVPYRADNLAALAERILSGDWTPASTLLPDAPQGLDAFFSAALAVDPGQRLPDMAAFVAGLEALHGHLETFVGPAASSASLQTAPASGSGSTSGRAHLGRRDRRAGAWLAIAAACAAGGVALTWAFGRGALEGAHERRATPVDDTEAPPASARGPAPPPVEPEQAGSPTTAEKPPDAPNLGSGGSPAMPAGSDDEGSSAPTDPSAGVAPSPAPAIPSARPRRPGPPPRSSGSTPPAPTTPAKVRGLSERNPFEAGSDA